MERSLLHLDEEITWCPSEVFVESGAEPALHVELLMSVPVPAVLCSKPSEMVLVARKWFGREDHGEGTAGSDLIEHLVDAHDEWLLLQFLVFVVKDPEVVVLVGVDYH